MALSEKEKELVAIGASIGGNCIPCLQYHYKKCKELGYSEEEMRDAIDMAKMVKEVPNKKIYETADKLNSVASSPSAPPDECCGGKPCC